jgi:hypothetical protein
MPSLKNRFEQHIEPIKRYLPAAFFVGGFLFDLLTLDEIDSLFTICLQGFYLFLISFILTQMYCQTKEAETGFLHYWEEYRTEIMHFCIGTLFSCYTIFYFKSASFMVSALFLFILAGLFLANEFKSVKQLGFPFKYGILALCLMSYFAYFVPVLVGKMGATVFMGSLVCGLLPPFILYRFAKGAGLRGELLPQRHPDKEILRPSLIVAALFLVLYMNHVIPPVPLSLRFIGVYHRVEKSEGHYALYSERPWWKIWQNGDQDFMAEPGDKIHIFFRLFSPARFRGQIFLSWFYKDPRQGWLLSDHIPLQIVGGRKEGFRGYGQKNYFDEGSWRVAVETDEGFEIGRIYFQVLKQAASSGHREWRMDLQ